MWRRWIGQQFLWPNNLCSPTHDCACLATEESASCAGLQPGTGEMALPPPPLEILTSILKAPKPSWLVKLLGKTTSCNRFATPKNIRWLRPGSYAARNGSFFKFVSSYIEQAVARATSFSRGGRLKTFFRQRRDGHICTRSLAKPVSRKGHWILEPAKWLQSDFIYFL